MLTFCSENFRKVNVSYMTFKESDLFWLLIMHMCYQVTKDPLAHRKKVIVDPRMNRLITEI